MTIPTSKSYAPTFRLTITTIYIMERAGLCASFHGSSIGPDLNWEQDSMSISLTPKLLLKIWQQKSLVEWGRNLGLVSIREPFLKQVFPKSTFTNKFFLCPTKSSVKQAIRLVYQADHGVCS